MKVTNRIQLDNNKCQDKLISPAPEILVRGEIPRTGGLEVDALLEGVDLLVAENPRSPEIFEGADSF